MTNAFNRGSAPGRARDTLQRTGSFEPGHKKRGGRKQGSRNLVSPEHKRALLFGGLGASALCFQLRGFALCQLGHALPALACNRRSLRALEDRGVARAQ